MATRKRATREKLEKLRAEYEELWRGKGEFMRGLTPETGEFGEEIEREYREREGDTIEKVAWYMAEAGEGRTLIKAVNGKLIAEGYPPIDEPRGADAIKMRRAARKYKKGETGPLEDILALMMTEALNKWIAELSGRRTTTLERFAAERGMGLNAARNQARRQTIPAFRKNGRWIITE